MPFLFKTAFLATGLLVSSLLASTQPGKPMQTTKRNTETAAWAKQSNIYEVNLRQYGPNGSFKGFIKELPRLKAMGVGILWFMPVTPISVKDRKGTLGSYYAVQHYRAVNPEYGTMNDWKALVKAAHALGFKVITDWVPNHSGADHYWLQTQPDFYARDSAGNAIAPFDWTDVRKLNYNNPALRDSMIASMKFWIKETDIDGYRCDVAGEVPTDFWKTCIDELRTLKDVFMLAEADKPELHQAGFNATYPWSVQSILFNIHSGKATLTQLQNTIDSVEKLLPPNAMRMYFTVNHDENSWNGTEFERFGEGYKAFAVLTATMHRSIPLIYSGQEEPNKKRLLFFEKDPIQWGKYEMAPFYKKLLDLRRTTAALATKIESRKLSTGNDDAIYAFVRQSGPTKVVVILNLSNQEQQFTINDNALHGYARSVFGANSVQFMPQSKQFTMKPWEYIVYRY